VRGVTFTMKDMKRYSVVKAVMDRRMTNREGAAALGLSVRQLKRIKKKVKRKGMAGIRHGNWGRAPAHAFPEKFKKRVIKVVTRRYKDFNFSHLAEMLEEEEEIRVNRETLRLWLRPLGFGGKVRKQPRHRKRRQRSAKMGQMLFLDGSPHRWFGDIESTLLLVSDDATGNPLYGLFRNEEDLKGCFMVCQEIFTRYGLPACFYLDRASQFTTTRRGGLHVRQRDEQPTQFERAMGELAVRLIFADSPEARGRAERINQTFQDRLVAELKLRGITTADAATTYLNKVFIPRYRFGVLPEEDTPAWRRLGPEVDLRHILCRRVVRTVNKDNTISVDGQIIQILPTRTRLSFAKAKVIVNLWLDGTGHVVHPEHGELPCKLLPRACPAGENRILRAATNGRAHAGGVTDSRCKKGDIFMLQ
jgi:transposase